MRDRNPFEEIEKLFERMSEQFEDPADWPVRMGRETPVDVVDVGDAYEVRVDLPGFEKDDVELTLSDATLRVHATREDDVETDVRYVRRERSDGAVDRTVTLPDSVDEASVDATLAAGVLTVTLGKEVTGEDAKSIDIE
jgi:HSP20 family protein